MSILNYNAFKSVQIAHEPYWHASINHILTAQAVHKLHQHLPIEQEVITDRQWGSDKTYHVRNSMLYELNEGEQPMPPHWRSLIQALLSEEYKRHISECWDYDVSEAPMEIIFKRYLPGDYISPHTDRDFVFGTHLFFFNDRWQNNWGGLLQILNNERKIVKEIKPLFETSLLFKQSDHSWHAVNAIAPDAEPRLCLQVTFWRHTSKQRTPGRMEYRV